jgi:hypothetical protein
MPLPFMFLLSPQCGGDVLLAKSSVNIIATYAIVNSIVSIKDAGKRNTLHSIEVCNSLIIFGKRFDTRFIILSFINGNFESSHLRFSFLLRKYMVITFLSQLENHPCGRN